MAADDIIVEARKAFERAQEAESDNRERGLADLRFARHGEQWPEDIKKARESNGKPCLTINKFPSFIRQVVNDARQNKPEMKAQPVDNEADIETAKIINGIYKQIEVASSADIAYDTAVESAVSNGFGYLVANTRYAYDDAFEQDICIERVADPFSIYGDPASTSADGSDWNVAFQTTLLTKDEFDAQYGGKAKVNWNDDAWSDIGAPWRDGDSVLVAVYWTRKEVDKVIVKMSDGRTYSEDDLAKVDEESGLPMSELLAISGITEKKRRTTKSHEVTRRVMSGAEELEKSIWPGKYIPIVPVYGEEYFIEGKRYLQSLIFPAKGAAVAFNVMRSTSVELFGMQPKSPWIGAVGAFATARDDWNTANTASPPFLEFDVIQGANPPQRQPLDMGPAAGAMQEALAAADDVKDILGMHDASLGIRSNETSGKAIMARQHEGDISTFHFIDNMARAVRQLGRIVLDLMPHIYNEERIVRVIGEDGTEEAVPVNQQHPKMGQDGKPMMQPMTGEDGRPVAGPDGQPMMVPIMQIFDLTVGKYDVVVSTGPNFTTRREEAAQMMTEFVRAWPQAAPLLLDLVAKNEDWPGADILAERLKHMIPAQAEGGLPPEVEQQMGEMKQALDQAQQEIEKLQASQATDMAKIKSNEDIKRAEIASNEKIEEEKLLSQRRIQLASNDQVETVGPDGEAQIKNATMQGIEMLGQMIMQQGQMLSAGMQQIAASVNAPNELIRDPNTGRAVGSRKVAPAFN